MTASIKAKNGIWQMIFSYKDSSGKWRQKSESTGLSERGNKRKAEAMKRDRLAVLEQAAIEIVEASNALFLDEMQTWLDDVMVLAVRSNTLDEYRRTFSYHIKTHVPFQGLRLQDLTPRILQGYYNSKGKTGISPNSLRKHHANIGKFLKYALSLDMITSNPAERVTLPPKVKSQVAKFYTADQLKTLLHLFWNDPLEIVVFLAATLGLRRSELCGLRWDAVDFDTRRIYIRHTAVVSNGKVIYADHTKSLASCRVLPMGDAVFSQLKEAQAAQARMQKLFGNTYTSSGYVCTNEDGTPVNPDFVTHHFQRKIKASDLPNIRFHDLRHSTASMLHESGYDLKDIQSWLGHSDIQTTAGIYTHLGDHRMDYMAQAMGDALKPQLKIV